MVVPHRPSDIMRDNALIDWEPQMDAYLGKEFIIQDVAPDAYKEAYLLKNAANTAGEHYIFAKEWFIPIK